MKRNPCPSAGLTLYATFGLCLVAAMLPPVVASAPGHVRMSLESAVATRRARSATPTPVLFAGSREGTRRLRGDYESVDLLLLVHDPDWEPSLRRIIEHAHRRAIVQVLMLEDEPDDARFKAWARRRSVRITPIPHDSPWIRDYGPFQLFDGDEPLWADYGYNTDRALDDAVPWELAYQYGVSIDTEFAYLEGGAVVSNGRGLCAISDRSLLETGVPLQHVDITEEFVARLGCRALSVLPALPDEQTGHVDVTVQFLSPRLVAVASMDREKFPLESRLLDRAAETLRRSAQSLGQRLSVLRVPMAADGEVYYSYLNGTRVADAFFVPSYEAVPQAMQQQAHAVLRAALPGVELVPIAADLMVELGGAVHCITLGLRLPGAGAQATHRPTGGRSPPEPMDGRARLVQASSRDRTHRSDPGRRRRLQEPQ